MIVFEMFACHTRTVHTPFFGMRAGSIKPLLIANGPTAADRLPQLPLQSTNALSIDTWPNRYSMS